MNKGEERYFKVIKSLGTLMTCAIQRIERGCAQFGMTLLLLNADKGRCIYQIVLSQNGFTKDIQIGNNSYSYLISNSTTLYKYYIKNNFTIEYAKGDSHGKIEFESDASSQNGEILLNIIYAIILLNEISDIEKVKNVFTFLFYTKGSTFSSLGARIDLYKEIKNLKANIIEKYPFMNEPINNGMNTRLQTIKDELIKDVLTQHDH